MAFPVTLNGRTYTLADFSGTNYVEGFPDALEDFVTQAGDIYNSTSSTSNAIGIGSKTFTVEANKPYQAGTPLRIADAAAPATNFMDVIVTSYSGTSLVVSVFGFAGSGTYTSWTVNIGGAKTVDGTLPVAQGGTGATTAADARTNLDTYSKAEADSRFLNVSGEASDVVMNGSVTIGDSAGDTLTVNATATMADATLTTADINGGTIDGVTIGGTTPGAATVTSLTATTADINGGTIDGTVIGGSTPAAISGTTGSFSGNLTVDTNTLFVDASNNRVGVGTSSPSESLDVAGTVKANDYFVNAGGHIEFDFNGIAAPFTSTSSAYIFTGTGGGGSYPAGTLNLQTRQTENRNIQFITGTTPTIRATVGGNGDITFFDASGNASFVYDENAGSVFNEQGADRDFRIESDTNTHAFFVDASTGAVGFGIGSPNSAAQISYTAPVSVPAAGAGGHALAAGSAGYGVAIGTTTGGAGYLQATRWDGTATNYGLLLQPNGGSVGINTTSPSTSLHVNQGGDGNGITLAYATRGAQRHEWQLSGTNNENSSFFQNNGTDKQLMFLMGRDSFTVNEDSANMDFRVESDTNTHALFVDAGTSSVLAGSSASFGGRIEAERLGFSNTGNDNWKKGAFVAKGSFGGAISLVNDGGASDGFAFYLTGTPSVLSLQFGANGGTMSAGVQLSSTATSWAAFSDARLKTVTSEISGAVASVNTLRAVNYTLNSDDAGTPRVGLIAQEVQAVLPEAVDVIDEDGHLGLRYTEVIPLLVAAIKEQQTTIETLEARIAALENA